MLMNILKIGRDYMGKTIGSNRDFESVIDLGDNTTSISIKTNTALQKDPIRGYFDEHVHEIADEIADLVVRKQHDYGHSNILNAPFGPESGLLVRLWDKFARLRNLLESGKGAKNESIEDTYKDIIGYCLIALMIRNGVFDTELRPGVVDGSDS